MVHNVIDDAISPLHDFGIPSISEFIPNNDDNYDDRYLHNISHVKIDDDDVVVYTDIVDMDPLQSGILGVRSMTKELLRIPKDEVKDLIVQLMSKDK